MREREIPSLPKMKTKTCSKCKKGTDLNNFYITKNKISYWCKKCHKVYGIKII